ncbi:MAG TPA: hypothetical protein VH592_05415 [Gemmataceae bacterium]|jgi:hypothetical protein
MWKLLLFSHWGWIPPSYYPFQDILEHPHVIHIAERLPPPHNAIHIELTHDGGRLELWFDPKVNYLVRKSIMIPAKSKTYRWEDEVIEFLEGAPAVFVPIVIEHRKFVEGRMQAVLRTTLSDVAVNQPLDKDMLRLPGIAGMECTDVDRQVKYKVDGEGNPVGREISVPALQTEPPSHPAQPPISSGASRSSPLLSWLLTHSWMWNLIVLGIVLVVAMIVAIVRRRTQSLPSAGEPWTQERRA